MHVPHSICLTIQLTIDQHYRATATAPILVCKEKIDDEILCRRAASNFPRRLPIPCLLIYQKQLRKRADRSSGSSRFFCRTRSARCSIL